MGRGSCIRACFFRVADGIVYKGYTREIEISPQGRGCVGEGIETVVLNDDFVLFGARDVVVLSGAGDAAVMGKALNRALYDGSGNFVAAFAGNFMVVRHRGGKFASIQDGDVDLLERLLKPVDHISCDTVLLKEPEELPEWEEGVPVYQPTNRKALYSMWYPPGTVIELTEAIDDPYTPKPVGSRFHVDSVDDAGQLHGRWESGGSMAVDVEHDRFKIVK